MSSWDAAHANDYGLIAEALLRERAGPGIVAAPDGSVPAVDFALSALDSAPSSPVRATYARALTVLGAYEQEVFASADSDTTWRRMLSRVAQREEAADNAVEFPIGQRDAESLNRLLGDEAVVADLLVAQWQNAIEGEYEGAVPLCAAWSWSENPAPAAMTKPGSTELSGLLDLTGPEASTGLSLSMKLDKSFLVLFYDEPLAGEIDTEATNIPKLRFRKSNGKFKIEQIDGKVINTSADTHTLEFEVNGTTHREFTPKPDEECVDQNQN